MMPAVTFLRPLAAVLMACSVLLGGGGLHLLTGLGGCADACCRPAAQDAGPECACCVAPESDDEPASGERPHDAGNCVVCEWSAVLAFFDAPPPATCPEAVAALPSAASSSSPAGVLSAPQSRGPPTAV